MTTKCCAWLVLSLYGLAAGYALASENTSRLVFTGDILLARLVSREVAETGQSPWQNLDGLYSSGDILIGNLEGAVGTPAQCLGGPNAPLCFPVATELLPLAKRAGFAALGLENNHAGDLGTIGRGQSRSSVEQAGMRGLTFALSPQFIQVGNQSVGVVSFSRIKSKDGDFTPLGIELEQKLDTARQLSDASIAFVHWGAELVSWPSTAQYKEAETLLSQGADLIVGHHPHVVQAPECVNGHPVFFSLGNHVFDQKYAPSKEGMAAVCRLTEGGIACEGQWTHIAEGTSFPAVLAKAPAPVCTGARHPKLEIEGVTIRAEPQSVLATKAGTRLELWADGARQTVEPARIVRRVARIQLKDGIPASLLVLEDHYSPLDRETAVRPYVYAVHPTGLVAQWRGSVLAYPLVDATVLPSIGGDILCALHKDASFLTGAHTPQTALQFRTLAYRWNGFGFSAVSADAEKVACARRYSAYLAKPALDSQ